MNKVQFFKKAQEISEDPMSRIPTFIRSKINNPNNLINVHCHIFNDSAVPKRLFNIKMPYSRRLIAKIATKLHRILGRSNDDLFSRWAYFIETFKLPTKTITDKLIKNYPEDTIFCPLMMDMIHGRKGHIKNDEWEKYIKKQSEDIYSLLEEKYTLLPFIPIDPLNKKVYNIFIKGFNGEYGFKPIGIKVYPSLGYLPSHPTLMNIYKVCQEKNIPVTFHCSSAKVRSFRKRIKDIEGWKVKTDGTWTQEKETRWFLSATAYRNYFNHPKNLEIVLETFPKLRVNIAHYGGEKSWRKLYKGKNNSWVSRIMYYQIKYDNVYADLSFTNAYPKLLPLIKERLEDSHKILEKTLYGLDYYMVVVKGHYKSLKTDFDTAMGDKIINKIGKENPRKFLL